MTRLADNHWFAGFADGEGCFYIGPQRVRGCQVTFSIGLRADDVSILRELHAEFGGTINFQTQRKNGKEYSLANWIVGGKADLKRLVAYFDRFQLRAKKARDYAVWREAVVVYVKGGRHAPELAPLRKALVQGRVFASEPPQVAPVEFEQLRVIQGGL